MKHMDTPDYRIIHDADSVLGLNPLIVYFFFTEETSRYKAIMANPCDNHRIFRFERLDKGSDMAHVLKDTELGNALNDSNMLVRLFTMDGQNDLYFTAHIPYEGRPREMRPYVTSLMEEVYRIDLQNIQYRLTRFTPEDTDVHNMLSYVLDSLKGRRHDRSFYLTDSEKDELQRLQNKIDKLHNELYPRIYYSMCKWDEEDYNEPGIARSDEMMFFELHRPSGNKATKSHQSHTCETKDRQKTIQDETERKLKLLEQIKQKILAITDAADTIELNELQQLWQILSGSSSSIEDSNSIAAGIFDNDRSGQLSYKYYMEKVPGGHYDIKVRVGEFTTEGRQHKIVCGIIVSINGHIYNVHFSFIDSRMLYITTLARLKYNIALRREDMIIRWNLFDKKKDTIRDMRFLYEKLRTSPTKEFENWYLMMDNLHSADQKYADKCHESHEKNIDGAISKANKSIFAEISTRFPEAMYYLGISNRNRERYNIRLSAEDITLPYEFTSELEKAYNVVQP